MALESFTLLTIGLDDLSKRVASGIGLWTRRMDMPLDIEKLGSARFDIPPSIVICGPPPPQLSWHEFGKLLRSKLPETVIFYVTVDRTNFDRKLLQKEGFNDAFVLPADRGLLHKAILHHAEQLGNVKVYRPVQMIDLTPGEAVDFDTYVYFPANKKYIKYSSASVPLDRNRVERLAHQRSGPIYVSQDQVQNFYRFVAGQFRKINSDQSLSETERREKLNNSVRDLMSGAHTLQVLQDCIEIIKAYMTSDAKKAKWYTRISEIIQSGSDGHSHLSSVSATAGLLSLGTGIGDPSDLVIAGLLHDVGLAELPADLRAIPYEEMNDEQKTLYHQHPATGLGILEKHKLNLSESVQEIIIQHHERADGQGFPFGLKSGQIRLEAQILALADQLDYRIASMDEKSEDSFAKAIQSILKSNAGNLNAAPFSAELVDRVTALFNIPE